MRSPVSTVGLAALLSACTLAPKYQEPATASVVDYKEAGDWLPAHPADAETRSNWWSGFGEPRLDELERTLHDSNPDVRAAFARFEQARALALGARSNIFPSLGAGASAKRDHLSMNAPVAGAGETFNDFIASLNLSWEIDLFGRLRSEATAAGARAESSHADLAAITLSLEAELASDYFTLRGADAQLRLLEDTVQTYDRAYELTRDRYEGAIAAATDVDQADTQRQNARAQLAAVKLQRAQLEHAIAVLLGSVPSAFSLESGELASAPPPVGAGLPSTLLQRRPDVASAERAVAAANAEIGVARAAWFPVFTLTGAAGFESSAASSWVGAPSRFWSVGPAGQVPLLDFGARTALTRQARAAYDEAVANYRKTTLTAYQEVEDNLAALHHVSEELAADEAAAASAQRAAYHADKRYTAGVADYIEVTTTQTAALQAQRAALDARVSLLNAAIGLVRATGGGWSREQLALASTP
jgi:NodT family efflux transporter outer membrane factor (OMF) lipoprotein